MALAWMALTLLPLVVLFGEREVVAGWDAPSALIVMAYFMACARCSRASSARRSSISSSASATARSTTCCSSRSTRSSWCRRRATSRGRSSICSARSALAVYAFVHARRARPRAADLALGILLFVAGVLAMYSLWIVCAAASFWVVRLDNLRLPARRDLRHRALAGPGVPRHVALRVHVHHPGRGDDDVPGDGAARPQLDADGSRRSPARVADAR